MITLIKTPVMPPSGPKPMKNRWLSVTVARGMVGKTVIDHDKSVANPCSDALAPVAS